MLSRCYRYGMVVRKTSRKRRLVEVEEVKCECCGQWFETKSHRAKFCSDACRQAAFRAMRRQRDEQ